MIDLNSAGPQFEKQRNQATISLITSKTGITKRFSHQGGKKLVKTPGGQLTEGIVTRVTVTPDSLAALLPVLKPTQAFAFGICPHTEANILSREKFDARPADNEPTVTRTRDFFEYPIGPGVMMLDFDPQDGVAPLTRSDAQAVLKTVWPSAAQSPMVWADSASSHIHNAKTGEVLKGAGGLRCYLFVQDARDIPRAGAVLCQRLTLAGYGWIKISGAGTMLPKTVIDGSVYQPERLDFAAGADCVPPLTQNRPAPAVLNQSAKYLDTRTMLDLSSEEQDRHNAILNELKAAVRPEADRIREQWLEGRVQTEAKAQNATDPEEVQRIRESLSRAAATDTLGQDFPLITSKGQTVTVKEILADRDKWHKTEFHDPLEPEYGNDPRIAVALLRGCQPQIYSHAHGGKRYFLEMLDGSEFEDCSQEEQPKPQTRLRGLRRDELMASPDLEWLIKGVMPSRGVGVVYGPSTVGKSFLELDKAAALAEGRDWFGYRVRQTKVVYACLEGQHGFKRRVMAWEAHHRRRYPDGVIFCPDPFDLRSDQDTAALIELAKAEAGPGAVVIIDTLNRAAPGMEENGSKDYGLILANAGKIEQAVDGFVCFVGHPGKDASKGLRGHYSMFAGLDMVLEVEEVNKASLSFAWITRKVKDGQDGTKRHFKREVVALFEDADGDLVTSCVILPDEGADNMTRAMDTERKMTAKEGELFALFMEAAKECGELDDAGNFSGVHLVRWQEFFFSAYPNPDKDARRMAFKRTHEKLTKAGWLYRDAVDMFRPDGPGSHTHEAILTGAIQERTGRTGTNNVRTSSQDEGANTNTNEQGSIDPVRVRSHPGKKTQTNEPAEMFNPRDHGLWSGDAIHLPDDCAGHPQICAVCVHFDGNLCGGLTAPF